MKKAQRKNKKQRTEIEMKITPNNNSKNNNSNSQSIKNTAYENGAINQKNKYPSDIQGLFERLGID